MKRTRKMLPALLGLLLVATLAQAETKIVKIDGSSTVYPITEAVAEEFQAANKGKINVTVGISGTGGGFKKFCRGEIDISDASRPILKKEMDACREAGIEYIELPVAYDALTVVVNPKNDWLKSITVDELKKMWVPEAQQTITNWNQVNPAWPNEPLKLYGPGADSGTFDYFTEAIVGKAKSSRGDYTASEDDNVLVQGVSRDKGGPRLLRLMPTTPRTAKNSRRCRSWPKPVLRRSRRVSKRSRTAATSPSPARSSSMSMSPRWRSRK